jgi:hypothetical protein
MTEIEPTNAGSGIERRTIMKGAAWSLPVIALAVATPAAAASGDVNVGAFAVNGTCGALDLGAIGAGFTLTAGSAPLPVGTVVTVSGTGIASIAALGVTGGLASVTVGASGQTFTLTAEQAAGSTISFTSLVTIGVGYSLTAVVTLPTGYVAGEGAKDTGSLDRIVRAFPLPALCTPA